MNRVRVLFVMLMLTAGSLAHANDMVPPGVTDVAGGEGTYFQLGSVSVSAETTAAIRCILEGNASTLTFHVESISGPGTARLTFSGLAPSFVYHLYVDNLHSARELTSDEKGQLSFTQDLAEPHLIFIKDHPSTVFISSTPWTDQNGVSHPAGWSYTDGADLNGIMGSWDPATLTATLLHDASEPIQILSSFVVLDGAGHTLQAPAGSSDAGVYITRADNTAVRNLGLSGWYGGIRTYISHRNTFTNNVLRLGSRGIHIQNSNNNNISNNVIENVGYGIFISVYCNGNTFDSNIVRYGSISIYCMGMSGSNIYSNNLFDYARDKAFYHGNTGWNKVFGNTFSNTRLALFFYGPQNHFYNNNFLNVARVASLSGYNTTFNEPLPVGGNYYADWPGPDVNGDGFVDAPRPILGQDGTQDIFAYDNLPYTRPNGWIKNQAPVFSPVGALSVVEYDQIVFPVEVSDPDGDTIVTVYAQNLPAGASFDNGTRQFSWRPDGTQAGVYVVNFFAIDDRTPVATGQLDVVITVGEIASPADLNGVIVAEIQSVDLLPEVENSYLANLQSADEMIAKGNITAVVNQYQAVIQKIAQDVKKGKIAQRDADLLTLMANDAISLLN